MTRPGHTFDTEFGRFYRHPAAQPRVPQSALAEVLETSRSHLHRQSPNPSVTNIMKMMDEGFLPGYHSRLVAEFALESWEQVTAMLSAGNHSEALELLRDRPNLDHMNSVIGTELHKAIEDNEAGLKPKITWPQAAKMFAQWLFFKQQTGIKLLRTEFTVWNYTHGYAGTGDMIAELDGIEWIIDTKSGTRIYPKVAMQNAAIQRGESVIVNGVEQPFSWVPNLGVLHVRPMSVRLHQIEEGEMAFEAFLACKRLFDWRRFDYERHIQEPAVETMYRKTTASKVIRNS